MPTVPVETFAALQMPGLRHAFFQRVPALFTSLGREEALEALHSSHEKARAQCGFDGMPFITAEQVHGCEIAIADSQRPSSIPGVDGLITNEPNLCLGIYVADCCAVYLYHPERRCIGLVHAGRKGTTLGIVAAAIEKMRAHFAIDPAGLIVQLSPCVRPPFYESNFAAEIIQQCRDSGVDRVFDCGKNTGADLQSYYSYRVEHGKTGRMLALLALT